MAGLATATVLTVTASGCVTVHGEREVVPSATRAEAARALTAFTDAYNKADKAYDPALDADRVTGAFGATTQAGFSARHVTSPGGNARYSPLELTGAAYTIPRQAGWPRWFVADTDSNRDQDDQGPGDTRWLLLFIRTGPQQGWKLAYLSILGVKDVPAFAKDKDGWAQPVRADDPSLALAPKDLSTSYASYLQSGKPAVFADGGHTSGWREARQKNAVRSGRVSQFVDQPLNEGDFALLGRMNATLRFLMWGTLPLGALAGGAVAEASGARAALWICAIGFLVVPLPLLLSSLRRMRDLPETAHPETAHPETAHPEDDERQDAAPGHGESVPVA
ncbi:hypothetical protein ABZ726_30670 [Streptomyces hundungensis]|uniref:hypothetical protein n=1 Tax=Streptomyces hundungensis TaxID=1077946 RepID=UPI0033D031AB